MAKLLLDKESAAEAEAPSKDEEPLKGTLSSSNRTQDPNNRSPVTSVMPGLEDDKLAGRKGCIAFVQSPKVCIVAIASGYNA